MNSINLLDKQRLRDDDTYGSYGNSLAWKARLFLFLGFALIAGGLAGSFVSLRGFGQGGTGSDTGRFVLVCPDYKVPCLF